MRVHTLTLHYDSASLKFKSGVFQEASQDAIDTAFLHNFVEAQCQDDPEALCFVY